MATVRLSGSEKRALVLWVLAGIVGLWYAHAHFFEAFPEASVNFKVTRGEALARAKSFVESLGQSVEGYRSVIVFGADDNAKTFLERKVGLKEANQLMASQVNVWNWEVRFFKPEQEEEYRVGVSPEGNVTGYAHVIPEAQAGGQPDRGAAQKTAQDFLTGKLGKSSADWDFLSEEANSKKKPNRLDWSFTWERHGFRAKDAPERLQIELHGSDIGQASEALKVPEQWERDYRHLRSTNEFYNLIAFVPYLLMVGGVLWIGIQLTRQGQTNWRLAIQLGVIAAILLTAMQLNKWPVDVSGYRTTEAYGSFIIAQIVNALAFGIASALTVALVLPGGEPLYREAKPQFLRLKKAFTWRGVRTKEFFSSTIVGLSLAAAQMGFLVAFYLIANHFGAWAPQEISYDDSLNTAIPWIGGLAIGLLAATSEEFLFRMFAIPYFQKVTKSKVVAVILPAFMWGFLHTAYPNEPPYIRGLEVGLIGIAVGIVMLYWGILATLIWHYTVDASLVGLLLIRSNSPYYKISGVVIGLAVLFPFAAAVYWRLSRGTFEDDADLINAAADPVETASKVETVQEVVAAPTGTLSNAMIGLLVACVVVGGVAAWKVKPEELGSYLKLSVNGKQATRLAGEILRKRGIEPQKYHSVTIFSDATDDVASEYLREKIGVRALNGIYEKRIPGALWRVRFFQDNEPEEYGVRLWPDGSLERVAHKLAEKTAGASLSKDEAAALAATFLQNEKQIDLSKWTLVDATSEKLPNRLDHSLTWQENAPLDGTASADAADTTKHAYQRVQVAVLGDEVTNFQRSIKIPDEWRRKQGKESVPRTLHTVFFICFLLGLGVAAVVYFLREIKSPLMRRLPWKRFSAWGLAVLAGYLCIVIFGNRIAQSMSQYNTAMPLKFMYGILGIGNLLGAFFYIGAVTFLFAVAWFFLHQAFGEVELPGWSGMPKDYYRDALLIGVGGTGAFLVFDRVAGWAAERWPTLHRAAPASFGLNFDALLPGISIPAAAALHGLLVTGLIAALAAFIVAHCKSALVRGMLFVVASLALVGDWGSTADFAQQWVVKALFLAVVVFGVARVARLNLLGYFLVLAIPGLVAGAEEMLAQPNGFYHVQGVMCDVALAVVLLWPVVGWMTAKREVMTATQG
ncbi:MAG TPA: CPBP family intramembrane glutamic endopeptidase [Candidatus Acidoferrum sp.]